MREHNTASGQIVCIRSVNIFAPINTQIMNSLVIRIDDDDIWPYMSIAGEFDGI